MKDNNVDIDISLEDMNLFFYTNDKLIRRMDDDLIMAKIREKYPDFDPIYNDNILKQAFILLLKDTTHIKYLLSYFNFDIIELFKVIYRNHQYIFNTCFITKVHELIKNRCYVKQLKR